MNAYINSIISTDENGEKFILYPRTKQEAVEGLGEVLSEINNNVDLLEEKSENYLELTGGTLSGDINTKNIVPTEAGVHACGKIAKPWVSVASLRFILRNAEGTASYGELIIDTEGTSETVGISDLSLGNKTPEGTEGNAIGQLTLYGNGRFYSKVKANDYLTKNVQHILPKQSGTLALQSEVDALKARIEALEAQLLNS